MPAMLQTKVLFTVLLFFAVVASAWGQDSTLHQPKHQLGINATVFVKEFLSFNTITAPADNPYLLTYKYMLGNNNALRAGLGFRLLSLKQSSSTLSNVPDSNLQNYYLRIGYEKQFKLAKRFIGYAGGDIRWHYEKAVSKTTVASVPPNQLSTVTTKNLAVGGGPVLGIEFMLSRRLSLSAEGAFLYFYSEEHKIAEDSRFPSLSTTFFEAKNQTLLSFPTTLYFIIKL